MASMSCSASILSIRLPLEHFLHPGGNLLIINKIGQCYPCENGRKRYDWFTTSIDSLLHRRAQLMMSTFHTTLSDVASWRPAWRAALICQPRLLLVVALLTISANSALADWNATPETIEQHPTWIYTPSTAMSDGKHPLLIALHGCAQTHTEIKDFGNLVPTAERNGIVVAVPFVGSEF